MSLSLEKKVTKETFDKLVLTNEEEHTHRCPKGQRLPKKADMRDWIRASDHAYPSFSLRIRPRANPKRVCSVRAWAQTLSVCFPSPYKRRPGQGRGALVAVRRRRNSPLAFLLELFFVPRSGYFIFCTFFIAIGTETGCRLVHPVSLFTDVFINPARPSLTERQLFGSGHCPAGLRPGGIYFNVDVCWHGQKFVV